jgi:hypothetical protein
MDSVTGLRLFDVNSLNEAVKGCGGLRGEKNCVLPGGTAVKITPSIPQRKIFSKSSSRLDSSGKLLHKRVTVQIGQQTFDMRISGSGGKLRVGGKVGTKKNEESFNSAFDAMKRCSDPTEKLCLLNLMVSLDPKRAKSELMKNAEDSGPFQGLLNQADHFGELWGPDHSGESMQNGGDLGIFEGLFDERGHPGSALDTMGAFKSYLGEKGIDNVTQFEGTIQSIYENLKLGHLSHKVHGGERERLDFSQSSFAREPAKIGVLMSIARHNNNTHTNGRSENISMENQHIFKPGGSPTGSVCYNTKFKTYVNPDRTMEAGLRTDFESDGTPKKISISDGQRLGLITPEKAQELQGQDLTEFTPLYVSFRATKSFADARADAANVMGLAPDNMKDAVALAGTIIDNLQPDVVPIFTGHSMGGMLAHAAGVVHNYSSIGFNSLGFGGGSRKWIDRHSEGKGCKRANDVNHAECHPTFAMRGDWVSDEEGSRVANVAAKKPYIGQRYIVENASGCTGINAHNRYAANIAALRNRMFD